MFPPSALLRIGGVKRFAADKDEEEMHSSSWKWTVSSPSPFPFPSPSHSHSPYQIPHFSSVPLFLSRVSPAACLQTSSSLSLYSPLSPLRPPTLTEAPTEAPTPAPVSAPTETEAQSQGALYEVFIGGGI